MIDTNKAREIAAVLQSRAERSVMASSTAEDIREAAALLLALADAHDRMAKDAARYQWLLRHIDPGELGLDYPVDYEKFGDETYKRQLDTAIDAAMKKPKIEYCWECNECGAQEYSLCISETDIANLNCGNCGANEWHKAPDKYQLEQRGKDG